MLLFQILRLVSYQRLHLYNMPVLLCHEFADCLADSTFGIFRLLPAKDEWSGTCAVISVIPNAFHMDTFVYWVGVIYKAAQPT